MSTHLAPAPHAYRRSAIMTATPGQLVVMLYDGANRYLLQAAVAMESRQVELAHHKLRRAEEIIQHLHDTLNMEAGGDVAVRLQQIYRFHMRYLNEARIEQSPAKIEKVAALLAQLRQSWAAIASSPEAATGPQAAA